MRARWIKSKRGYAIASSSEVLVQWEINSKGLPIFFIAIPISENVQQYIYLDSTKIEFRNRPEEMSRSSKAVSFTTLRANSMHRFFQENCKFSNSVTKHASPMPPSITLNSTNFFCKIKKWFYIFYSILEKRFYSVHTILLILSLFFYIFSKSKLNIFLCLISSIFFFKNFYNKLTDLSMQRDRYHTLLQLLEVGGIGELDEFRVDKDLHIYLFENQTCLFFLYCMISSVVNYFEIGSSLIFNVFALFMPFFAYFSILHQHNSGIKIISQATRKISPHGIINLLKKSAKYEKSNQLNEENGFLPSFFNNKIAISHEHVVLTVRYNNKTQHTALCIEKNTGGNRLTMRQMDFGYNNNSKTFFESSTWMAITNPKKEGILTERDDSQIDLARLKKDTDEGKYVIRSIIVSKKQYEKLRHNIEADCIPGLIYQIRGKENAVGNNCLTFVLRHLNLIGVLPPDLRIEYNKWIPGRSIEFKSNDEYLADQADAYSSLFCR